jgi:type II secretory pathway component GspD/PulD (secretin)
MIKSKIITISLIAFLGVGCSATQKNEQILKPEETQALEAVSTLMQDKIVQKTEYTKPQPIKRRTVLASSAGEGPSEILLPNFDIYINQKDVSLQSLLLSLITIADQKIYVSKEISGTSSLTVERAPWADVFSYVLAENNLVAWVDASSGSITIKPGVENDQFVTKLLGKNFALKKQSNHRYQIPEIRMEIFELYHVDPVTIKAELDDLFDYESDNSPIKVSGVTQNTGARVNEFASNADGVTESYAVKDQAEQKISGLIITATATQLDKIHKLVDSLDMRIPQVFIEAFILTVTDDFEKAFGSRLALLDNAVNSNVEGSLATTFNTNSSDTLDAKTALTNFAISGLTATSGINVLTKVGVDRLRLGLEAMEKDGFAKTVANPKIMVLNKEKGYFFQGTVLCWTFEAGGSSTTTDGGTTSATAADKVTQCTDGTTSHPDYPAPEGKEIGLKLEVVPTISLSNEIMLDINVQQTSSQNTSSTSPPTTSKLSLANRLLTNSGDIIVIGGNHSLSESFVKRSIPGAGGSFFGSFFAGGNEQDDQFQEMLIFLSARKM